MDSLKVEDGSKSCPWESLITQLQKSHLNPPSTENQHAKRRGDLSTNWKIIAQLADYSFLMLCCVYILLPTTLFFCFFTSVLHLKITLKVCRITVLFVCGHQSVNEHDFEREKSPFIGECGYNSESESTFDIPSFCELLFHLKNIFTHNHSLRSLNIVKNVPKTKQCRKINSFFNANYPDNNVFECFKNKDRNSSWTTSKVLRSLLSPLESFTCVQDIVVAPVFEPLNAVLNKIARGERVPPNVSMRYEMLRLCSFRTFPVQNKPFSIRFAQAGFYYASHGDEVICYCCAKRVSNWQPNDNPMEVHSRISPNCLFITNNAEVNVPAESSQSRSSDGNLLRTDDTSSSSSATTRSRIAEGATSSQTSAAATENTQTNVSIPSREHSRQPLHGQGLFRQSVADTSQIHSLPTSTVRAQRQYQPAGQFCSMPATAKAGQHRDPLQASGDAGPTQGSFLSSNRNSGASVLHDSVGGGRATQRSIGDNGGSETRPAEVRGPLMPRPETETEETELTQPGTPHLSETTTSTGFENAEESEQQSQSSPARGTQESGQVPEPIPAAPKYPQYESTEARRQTFLQCSQNLPISRSDLIEAGFYYAGVADCTKCFHCGIGLRHWSHDDEPWVEHARYSLECPYVLRKKGEEFVNLIRLAIAYTEGMNSVSTAQNAGPSSAVVDRVMASEAVVQVRQQGHTDSNLIRRAVIAALTPDDHRHITSAEIIQQIHRLEGHADRTSNPAAVVQYPSTTTISATTTTPPALSENSTALVVTSPAIPEAPASNTHGHQRRSSLEAAQTLAFERLTFSEDKQSSEDQELRGSRSFPVERRLGSQEERTQVRSDASSHTQRSLTEPIIGSGSSIPQQPQRHTENLETTERRRTLIKENAELRTITTCSVCKLRGACIVFLPCGHLVTCEECAPDVRQCFMCNQAIKGTVRTWRA